MLILRARGWLFVCYVNRKRVQLIVKLVVRRRSSLLDYYYYYGAREVRCFIVMLIIPARSSQFVVMFMLRAQSWLIDCYEG